MGADQMGSNLTMTLEVLRELIIYPDLFYNKAYVVDQKEKNVYEWNVRIIVVVYFVSK